MTEPVKWKLVPVEPTEEMCAPLHAAMRDFIEGDCDTLDLDAIWSAMLAAAPASPPAEALPSQTSGAEAVVRDALERIAWDGFAPPPVGSSNREKLTAEAALEMETATRPVNWIVARAALHVLDRTVSEPADDVLALAKPASEPAGGGVRAWMRRWAYDNVDVMTLKKADRPKGWGYFAVTVDKLLPDDVPLSSPASSSPAEAEVLQDGVEAVRQNAIMRKALREIAAPLEGTPIGDPWAFYADLQAVAEAALSSAQEDGSQDLGWHPRGSGPGPSSVEAARDDVARAIARGDGIELNWITDQSNPRWHRYRKLADFALAALSPPPTVGAEDEAWKPGRTVRLSVDIGYASPEASFALATRPSPAADGQRVIEAIDRLRRWMPPSGLDEQIDADLQFASAVRASLAGDKEG